MTTELIISGVVGFAAGYAIGRVDSLLSVLRGAGNTSAPRGFFAKTNDAQGTKTPANISIDERKFVTDIKTDTLVKTQDIQLGKQVVAQDDINVSINKLAQLKGK